MFIVLLDEPGLFVFESPIAAAQAIEVVEAESEIRAAFDQSAVPYRVEWIQPNRWGRGLFGLWRSFTPGKYRFVQAGPAAPADLRHLLENHLTYTDPPDAKADLERLLLQLRAV